MTNIASKSIVRSTPDRSEVVRQNSSPADRFLKLLPVAVALLVLPPSAAADPRELEGVILRGGHVVDFKNGWDEVLDVAFSVAERAADGSVEGGEIVCVGEREDGCFEGLDRSRYVVIDARGLLVMPGHVDTHVHLAATEFHEGLPYEIGLHNLVAAGVTTAFEVGSRPEVVSEIARRHGLGYGLSLASLYTLVPGDKAEFPVDPDEELLRETLAQARQAGALGLKLTGHYPLTPEAVQRAIRVVNESRSYVTIHLGFECEGDDGSCAESCRTPCRIAGGAADDGCQNFGSDLCGLEKTLDLLSEIELDGGRPGRAHIAHVNAYTRGQVLGDPAHEAEAMRKLLHEHGSHIVTESHLADFSTGEGRADDEWCGEDGALVPASSDSPRIKDAVVRMNLEQMGYADDAETATQANLRDAIVNGDVQMFDFETAQLIEDPVVGVNLFDAMVGADPCAEVVVAFFLYDTRISNQIATWTHGDGGQAVVDAFASDGGAAPRNVSCQHAFELYRAGALSGPMMAAKLSYNPARMLGLVDKGHLSVGADADLTLLDTATGEPAMSFTAGEMIMARGIPVPVHRRPTMIITSDGKTAMCPEGGTEPCLRYRVVDLGKDSWLYNDKAP